MADGVNVQRKEYELGSNALVAVIGVAIVAAVKGGVTQILAMKKNYSLDEEKSVEAGPLKVSTKTKLVPKVQGFKATKEVVVDVDQFGNEIQGTQRDK